jgi:hypothetical protein
MRCRQHCTTTLKVVSTTGWSKATPYWPCPNLLVLAASTPTERRTDPLGRMTPE